MGNTIAIVFREDLYNASYDTKREGDKMSISDKIRNNARMEQGFQLRPNYTGKTLSIEITNTCNEKCIYCTFAMTGIHKKVKYIDEELFYRVTKEAYDLGITDVGLQMMGEPFLNPSLYKYVSYLKKEIGFPYVYISTNGILCTPQNLEKLIKAGIDSIKFSVSSSNKDNYYRHHGVDAFDLVKKHIEYAFAYREENKLDYKLYMFSVVTAFNTSEREDIEKRFSPFMDEIVFSDVVDGVIPLYGLKEYLMVDKDIKYLGGAARNIPCTQLFSRISVDEEGFLCTCCGAALQKFIRVVDLHKVSLEDAVYSDKIVNIRQRHLDNNVEHIICNLCTNRVKEEMKPHMQEFDGEHYDLSCYNIENDIRHRFRI